LGKEQADEEHVDAGARELKPGVVDEPGKDKRGRLVVGRNERERRDDDEDAQDVPPDAHVVEERHQPDTDWDT
jgi:hypothetical protein